MRYERSSIRSVLGLRFRDATTERPVTEGLQVTVRRKDGRGPPTRAVRTVSGAYVAQGLAGLRAYERVPADIPEGIPEDPSDLDTENEANPLVKKNYLVDVHDRRGRFVPVLLNVELPYTPKQKHRWLYPVVDPPPEEEVGGEGTPEPTVYLFSSVQRPVPAGQAVLYADLVVKTEGEWQPAAHAVLKVRYDSNSDTPSDNSNDTSNGEGNGVDVWYGVADAEGRVAVQFPMPSVNLNGQSNQEPQGERRRLSRLSTHRWPLTVKVRYEPSTLTIPPGAERPPLPLILQQGAGTLFADTSTTKNELTTTLSYGEPLVLTTGDLSVLRIAPANGES